MSYQCDQCEAELYNFYVLEVTAWKVRGGKPELTDSDWPKLTLCPKCYDKLTENIE